MDYAKLRKNIISLANLPKSKAPIVSAYFDLDDALFEAQQSFNDWSNIAERTYKGEKRVLFRQAVDEIHGALRAGTGRSMAIFSRKGAYPFRLSLEFKVPMENYFHVNSRPAIFPLVEIKDRFNRFIVILTTQSYAKIVEMSLGDTSTEILAHRSEESDRFGREWTREHYHNRLRERNKKFVKEKVDIVSQLMSKGGNNSIIIAGDRRYTARFYDALPKYLQAKVIDHINTGFKDDRTQLILDRAIASYIDSEHRESDSVVKKLFYALRSSNMATLGVSSTTTAIQNDQVDQLVISSKLNFMDREKLVRMASKRGIPIETIESSQLLEAQGGAGSFLRYATHQPDDVYQKILS